MYLMVVVNYVRNLGIGTMIAVVNSLGGPNCSQKRAQIAMLAVIQKIAAYKNNKSDKLKRWMMTMIQSTTFSQTFTLGQKTE